MTFPKNRPSRQAHPLLRAARAFVAPPGRSEAGYRLYTEEEVAKLEFVKLAKLLGLTLGEIAELVGVAEEYNEGQIFPHIEELLAQKIAETERKIAELSAFREGLLYYSAMGCMPMV